MKCLTLISLVLVFTGCKSSHATQAEEALLTNPSTEIRQILEQAMGNLMNSQPIKIADSAFTTKSMVLIERTSSLDSNKNLIIGRTLIESETFTLLKKGKQCFLKHNQSDIRIKLSLVECKAK